MNVWVNRILTNRSTACRWAWTVFRCSFHLSVLQFGCNGMTASFAGHTSSRQQAAPAWLLIRQRLSVWRRGDPDQRRRAESAKPNARRWVETPFCRLLQDLCSSTTKLANQYFFAFVYICHIFRDEEKLQPPWQQSWQPREQSARERRLRLRHLRHPVGVLGRVWDGRRHDARHAAIRVAPAGREALQDPHSAEKNHSNEQTGQGIQAVVALGTNKRTTLLIAP